MSAGSIGPRSAIVWTAPRWQGNIGSRTAGRGCHASGLLLQPCSWPLAIMLSTDQLLVRSARFKGGWHEVGFPDLWADGRGCVSRSEEHTSELQSLMRISYAVFCLKKNKKNKKTNIKHY